MTGSADMETQEKIRKIIEFMNIPDFEQIMSAKLLELEIALRPKIKQFQEQKTKFKTMAGTGLALLENEEPFKRPPTFYFECKRVKDKQSWVGQKWTLWEINPEPVDQTTETVLLELAQSMGSYKTDPAKIEQKELFSEPDQRYFDVSFTKYSDTFAFGTLRQSGKEVETPPNEDYNNMIKLSLGYKAFKIEDSYGEMLRYLESYPEIRERLLAYFYMMEKPRIDKTLKKAG
jgi:hypothetical protein